MRGSSKICIVYASLASFCRIILRRCLVCIILSAGHAQVVLFLLGRQQYPQRKMILRRIRHVFAPLAASWLSLCEFTSPRLADNLFKEIRNRRRTVREFTLYRSAIRILRSDTKFQCRNICLLKRGKDFSNDG